MHRRLARLAAPGSRRTRRCRRRATRRRRLRAAALPAAAAARARRGRRPCLRCAASGGTPSCGSGAALRCSRSRGASSSPRTAAATRPVRDRSPSRPARAARCSASRARATALWSSSASATRAVDAQRARRVRFELVEVHHAAVVATAAPVALESRATARSRVGLRCCSRTSVADVGAHVLQVHLERRGVAGRQPARRLALERVERGGKRRRRPHGERALEHALALRPVARARSSGSSRPFSIGERTTAASADVDRAARLDVAELEYARIACRGRPPARRRRCASRRCTRGRRAARSSPARLARAPCRRCAAARPHFTRWPGATSSSRLDAEAGVVAAERRRRRNLQRHRRERELGQLLRAHRRACAAIGVPSSSVGSMRTR